MPSITVEAGGERKAYDLAGTAIVLGRGLEADVRLKDIKSSRRHCQISREGRGYIVSDLGSGNGTFLNGVQVNGSQKLSPGDRIQIGDTVITFEDDEAAAPPAPHNTRSGTQRMTNPRPTPGGHSAPQRHPTAAIQKPTSKTARTPSAMKPVTGPQRPQTSKFQRGTTQASRAPTSRATVGSKRTEQYAAQPRKSGKTPLIVGVAVVGAILTIFTIVLMIPDGESKRQELNATIERILKDAAGLRNSGKLDEAVGRYREALKVADGDPGLRKKYRDLEGVIKDIEAEKKSAKNAGAEWDGFKTEFDRDSSARTLSNKELLLKGLTLKRQYQGAGVAWYGELETCIQKLQRMVDTERAIEERNKFQGFRNELIAKFGVDKPETAKYGPAIVALRQWLESAEGEERRRGETELQGLEGRAEEAFKKIKARHPVILSEEGATKAREFLELGFQRMKGSKMEPEMRKLLDQAR